MQIRISTDNMILSEYENFIAQREMKNGQQLKHLIENFGNNPTNFLKHSNFRKWFTSFMEKNYPEKKGLVVLINLFFTSLENRNLIYSESKNQATMIYIDLLHETITKAHKTKFVKKTLLEDEEEEDNKINNEQIDSHFQLAFPENFFEIIDDNLWTKINQKYEEVKMSEIEDSTNLIDEIFSLFQIINDKLIYYLREFLQIFYNSTSFKSEISRFYMKKSCLINNFWFEKPEIKADLKQSIININNISPLKASKRERIMTNINGPKNEKEYKDLSQSYCPKSFNVNNF